MDNTKTKIVATIGPNSAYEEKIEQLILAGASMIRLNSSHEEPPVHKERIDMIRRVSKKLGTYTAILLDLQGPKIRVGNLSTPIELVKNENVILKPSSETDGTFIPVNYDSILSDVNPGETIFLDDGKLQLQVVKVDDEKIDALVLQGGLLKSRKGINIPSAQNSLASVTPRDIEFIKFGAEEEVDYLALSFVRSAKDILVAKEHLSQTGKNIPIIAKIEKPQALENIEEIIDVSDGIMVARGDLGIEVPQERIPGIQRMLIRKCILAKKPVIVATQMLHTMINNPRPTRAEVTDIANAIYYRTDALMLSGETAYGKYPVEAVKTMTKIAAQAEKDKLEENDIRIPLDENSNDVTAFLAKQAVKATTKLKIRAIITDSYQGRTARNLAAFRGKYPVLAICYKEKTMRHLALSYGVEAIYMPELANGQEYYFAALRRLLKEGRLHPTDMVGYLSSGKAGTQTSFLEINVVEDALKHAGDSVLPNSNRYL